LALAGLLVRWKRRLAPRGTRRAAGITALARTLLGAPGPAHLRRLFERQSPRVAVEIGPSLNAGGAQLPPRPRLLILKLDHIGDFVVGLTAMEILRAGFPDASITLVCGSWNVAWAERLGWFDRVVAFDVFAPSPRDVKPIDAVRGEAFARIGLTGYDLAIDLRHDPDTRPLLGLIGTKYRAGFWPGQPAREARLDLAMPECQNFSAGRTGVGLPHAAVRLQLLARAVVATFGHEGMQAARRLVSVGCAAAAGRAYVVLAPGAGTPVKCWRRARLIELAGRLLDRHAIDVVVVGGTGDGEDGQAIAAAFPGRASNLAGILPLAELPAILARARLFVGFDTGPTHLAAALDVPTVCLFSGASQAEVWRPVGPRVTVITGRTGCAPCRLVFREQCPNGVACIEAISTDDVLAACERHLAAP
jgi:ADP-heptose:LPS heptosyltransferase